MVIQEIEAKDDNNQVESDGVIESYTSWIKINNEVAIKKLDRSSFFHHGTSVPPQLRTFFQIEGLPEGGRVNILLNFNGAKYKAYSKTLRSTQRVNSRTQLHYYKDFVSVLRNALPGWYTFFQNKENETDDGPLLRFSHNNVDQEYDISIIDPRDIITDIESELIENQDLQPLKEGKIKEFYGKRYERSAENRKRAIEIHGYECAVCGFDFSKVYGERGKGFIEVHHVKPLSTVQEEIEVNPDIDLVTVCPNCHRMIHRYSDNVLSVDELRHQVRLNGERESKLD